MSAEPIQVALILDAADGGCTLRELRFPDEAVGPVDFAWSLQADGDFLCIGSGVLAGSVLPGSNRLIVAGRSPSWGGFYVSTLGGGSLIWDGTGLSFLAIGGRAPQPSVLVLTGARDGYPMARLERIIHAYLRAVREDSPDDADLGDWLWHFGQDRSAAARAYWDELRGGIDEGMAEPPEEGCR